MTHIRTWLAVLTAAILALVGLTATPTAQADMPVVTVKVTSPACEVINYELWFEGGNPPNSEFTVVDDTGKVSRPDGPTTMRVRPGERVLSLHWHPNGPGPGNNIIASSAPIDVAACDTTPTPNPTPPPAGLGFDYVVSEACEVVYYLIAGWDYTQPLTDMEVRFDTGQVSNPDLGGTTYDVEPGIRTLSLIWLPTDDVVDTIEVEVAACTEPTPDPSPEPTAQPTEEPTAEPTAQPTEEPTKEPTKEPSPDPSSEPTKQPTIKPTPGDGSWVYYTPGYHTVNGREWFTRCEPYSATKRCWTYIWGTQVAYKHGKFVSTNGWTFNNLTYLPMDRETWQGNRLAYTNSWIADDGRQWRTECDTARTGRGGCRSYAHADIVEYKNGKYVRSNKEVFNNIVLFN